MTVSTDPLGIWHTRYTLFDQNGASLYTEPEALSGRFALNQPPEETKEKEGLSFTITKDAEVYPIWGNTIHFVLTSPSSDDMR